MSPLCASLKSYLKLVLKLPYALPKPSSFSIPASTNNADFQSEYQNKINYFRPLSHRVGLLKEYEITKIMSREKRSKGSLHALIHLVTNQILI
jgi:hypothetical protein